MKKKIEKLSEFLNKPVEQSNLDNPYARIAHVEEGDSRIDAIKKMLAMLRLAGVDDQYIIDMVETDPDLKDLQPIIRTLLAL